MFRDDYGHVGEICAPSAHQSDRNGLLGYRQQESQSATVYVLLGGQFAIASRRTPTHGIKCPGRQTISRAKADSRGRQRKLTCSPSSIRSARADITKWNAKDRVHCVSLVEAVRSAVGPDVGTYLSKMAGSARQPPFASPRPRALRAGRLGGRAGAGKTTRSKPMAKAARMRIPVATGERPASQAGIPRTVSNTKRATSFNPTSRNVAG